MQLRLLAIFNLLVSEFWLHCPLPFLFVFFSRSCLFPSLCDNQDAATGIIGLKTMFIGQDVNVTLIDIIWVQTESATNDTTVSYQTSVNGVVQATGNYSLADVGRELPTSFFVGTVKSDQQGTSVITVALTLDTVVSETDASFQTYKPGLSILPLIVVLILAMTTRMVEFSLFCGVFVGACIVAGDINMGFKTSLDTYLLNALDDPDHVYVILFTLFLSGLVGMMVSQIIKGFS